MQVNLKNYLLIALFALASGFTFAQETEGPPTQDPEKTGVKKESFIYRIVDEPADFPGGLPALKEYLLNNLTYPQTAVKNKIEGKCYIQFVVSDLGQIENVLVKKGVTGCPECDEEAVRVVKNMPEWQPGVVNGKPVNSVFSLPISFKL